MASTTRSIGSFLLSVLWVMALANTSQAASITSAQETFFETEVRPLLADNCFKCHGSRKQEAELRLDALAEILAGGISGPAIQPGQPDKSLLVHVLRHQGKIKMPPDGKLEERQIEALVQWIQSGAPWPGTSDLPTRPRNEITNADRNHWSFRPITDPLLPLVARDAWCQTPIDRFILAKLQQRGVQPAPPANKRTLIRRATLNLIGLPPTPEDMASYLSDNSPTAFSKVMDRLLASPAYGQRWGRHWLDVVRYADARDLIQLPVGSDFRESWRYRDWVVDAFNSDMSYDKFVQYQIAGDLLQPPTSELSDKGRLIATGMLALADFVPGDVDKDLMVADYVDDMINVVGQAVMGLTLACARCHDHKFDPFTTEDYYRLAGIFFSTRLVEDIPGNPGNTPLTRVELLTPTERQQIDVLIAQERAALTKIERQISDIYQSWGTFELVSVTWGPSGISVYRNGKLTGTNQAIDGLSSAPNIASLSIGVSGSQNSPKFRGFVSEVQVYDNPLNDQARSAVEDSLIHKWFANTPSPSPPPEIDGALLRFCADDPELIVDDKQRVTRWPDQANERQDATTLENVPGPHRVNININGHSKPTLQFTGNEALQALGYVPPAGSIFIVFKKSGEAIGGERLIGWEDSTQGRHGIGIQPEGQHALRVICRQKGVSGDVQCSERVSLPEMLVPEKEHKIAEANQARLKILLEMQKKEQELLDKKPKREIPQAVVVKDGGPVGTKYAGFQDAFVFIRGDHKRPGKKVPRGFPLVLTGENQVKITAKESGRRELAEWISRADHPLTARVLVNRLWQHHFGAGIVTTTTNFGRRGTPPSHPRLLDFLASRFIESGWSMKSIHRQIMLSTAYQQSSRFSPEAHAIDPQNHLIWKMNRQRLEGEILRDALLAVANRLNLEQCGPSFQDLSLPRRTLYLMTARTGAQTSDFGPLFDRADCGAIVGQRTESTVAPQALFMMNDPFVIEQAKALAERVQFENDDDVEKTIERIYNIALGRPASQREIEIGTSIIAQSAGDSEENNAWDRLSLIVLCTNEFLYID